MYELATKEKQKSWIKQIVNQKMRKNNFTAMTKMMILQNMTKKKNTLERNNMAIHNMGIAK